MTWWPQMNSLASDSAANRGWTHRGRASLPEFLGRPLRIRCGLARQDCGSRWGQSKRDCVPPRSAPYEAPSRPMALAQLHRPGRAPPATGRAARGPRSRIEGRSLLQENRPASSLCTAQRRSRSDPRPAPAEQRLNRSSNCRHAPGHLIRKGGAQSTQPRLQQTQLRQQSPIVILAS